MKNIVRRSLSSLALVFIWLPAGLRAHCDTLEGPVVQAARQALARGEVTPVLMWVKAADEEAIRAAFARTLAVRKQSKEAAELADTWFFETLVRIHRAGEGAPYTGLKAGAPSEPGIAAADRALASRRADEVLAATVHPLHAALEARFQRVVALRAHAEHTVAAGREYVDAYVDYVHFAERLASLASGTAAAAPAEHHH